MKQASNISMLKSCCITNSFRNDKRTQIVVTLRLECLVERSEKLFIPVGLE